MDQDSRASAAVRAVWRLLAGAVLISFAPVFVRLVDVAPTASAFYRTGIGGVVLLLWTLARGRSLRIGARAALAVAGAGLAFAADLALWHRSILYVGPGLATLLANFQVFGLAIVGVFWFGEKLRARLLLSIVLAVVGLGLIVGTDWAELGAEARLGLLFGLGTAVAYVAYILCLRRAGNVGRDRMPGRDLALASLVSALCLLLGSGLDGAALAIPSAGDGALLVAYALTAQVLGWILISSALEHVPASRVGLILLLQPSLAFVWDVLFFARPFGPREALGAALAIAAIYLGNSKR
ncbi:DMT family transporter [Haliangium ochraceum]|uniref:EamA domain-containing protein n=1 Tax=Haliangium ochraceum (strain DSM 14365 / JCM 11303 / SMP-2) TaxID=502025 RepID=D0LJK7_HALO1|nr:DMT family transporter [Haliangium ochraceum]ACY16581.1 protein of unknown function DUF6 transmembrane [Haliangium ochraceum DSM 14365]